MQVIARLDGLQVLNATPVTSHERKDSELQYVRRVLGESPVLQRPSSPATTQRNKLCLSRLVTLQFLLSSLCAGISICLVHQHLVVGYALHGEQSRMYICCLQVSWAVCQAARQRPSGASTHVCSSSRTGL